MKLKALSMHKLENVPDHLIEEMREFAEKLGKHNIRLVEGVSPNIALAGLNWMLAAMVKHLVTNDPEELRNAAKFCCHMMLKNMEILIDMEKNNHERSCE